MKRLFLISFALFTLCGSAVQAAEAYLPQVDLVLPPALETPDAPFYRGAKVKIDDHVVPVTEGTVAPGQVAEYQPENDAVVVTNATNVSEIAKGQALLDVVTAMQVGTIATAAGTEKTK